VREELDKKRRKEGDRGEDGRERKKAKERIDRARTCAKNILNVNERA